MPAPRSVVLIGPGRMGQGLGLALHRRDHPVTLLGRRPRALDVALPLVVEDWRPPLRSAGVVLVATPDEAVPSVARHLAGLAVIRPGQAVLHLSGLLDRAALSALEDTGAGLGSFHPLQTVADPASAPERLAGSYVGLEGDAAALAAGERLAAALVLRPVHLAPGAKAAYHAAASIVANYTVVLAEIARRLARDAGVPEADAGKIYLPLLAGALANLEALGPAEALTGPIRRGDAATVAAHLRALPPTDRAVYLALGAAALELARAAGLAPDRAAAVAQALEDARSPTG